MAEHILWQEQTFTTTPENDWGDGVVATSKVIDNTNSANNALMVFVEYEALTPDGENQILGSQLLYVLQEEIVPGKWVNVATQGRPVKGSDNASTHILRLRPGLVLEDAPVASGVGGRIDSYTYHKEGVLGGRNRVVVMRDVFDPSKPVHTSVKLTGKAVEYQA